jgi:diguanylate cyclase (GGDEF)-like protein
VTEKIFPIRVLAGIHKRVPLTTKMLVLTIGVGLIVWTVLDRIHIGSIKDIFQSQLSERLKAQSLNDRISFDRHVKTHLQSAKLFVSQKSFSDYVDRQDWSVMPAGEDGIEYYNRPPGWFPKLSVLRAFAMPRFALLLDHAGNVREVFKSRHDMLPDLLLHPTNLMISKSSGQNFIVGIEGMPYLVSSQSYVSYDDDVKAILMLASPMDDEFLTVSMGTVTQGHTVALLTSDETRILTSSNIDELPSGTLLEELRDRYLVTGREFFDYGAAEEAVKFVSLTSLDDVDKLTDVVISRERQKNIVSAVLFILSAVLVMFWVTRRVQNLTKRVREFSEDLLGSGVQEEAENKGDQLFILNEKFQHLTEEVIKARDRLKKEVEERIVLEKRQLEMEEKERHLELLQSVTETLSVGVIIEGPGGIEAANKQMEYFIETCGGTAPFSLDDGDIEERSVVDNKGITHIFEVSSHNIFDEKIILVRDITELKAHTELLEHMALHDSLTGLPNRSLFYDRIEHAIYVTQREDKHFAMLMIDLDGFKLINDTLGHHIGDLVLQEVSKRMMEMLRKADTVARLGGDEFAVLLLSVDGIDDSREVAAKLLETLKAPMIFDGESLNVDASIGIVLYPEHGSDADSLVKNADLSMYVAKKSRRGISIYNPD